MSQDNLKTPVERYLYHTSQAWQALEELVDDWQPRQEKYASPENLATEFMEYYHSLAGRDLNFFTPDILQDMLSKSKYEVLQGRVLAEKQLAVSN